MAQQAAQPGPDQIARIIHSALAAGPVFLIVAVGFLSAARPEPLVEGNMVLYALVGLTALLLVSATTLGRQIAPRKTGQSPQTYWQATLPKAVMVWALLEAAGLVAGVVGLLAGQMLIPAIGVLLFLVMMVLYSPGRLAGS